MKLLDVIIISLAVVFIIIGIYETMRLGFGQGYWAVMIALVLFFVHNHRRNAEKKN